MPSNLRIEWGQRLRHRREQLGLSLCEVARRAGTGEPYYRRIERGEIGTRGPSDDMRMRIAAALSVRVEDVWSYPEPEQEAS